MNRTFKIFIRSAMVLLLALLPGEALANSYWFYPKATVAPTGQGSVYISKNNTTPSESDYGTTSEIEAWSDKGSSAPTATIYCYGKPATTMGDCYTVWTLGGKVQGEGTSYQMTVTAGNKDAESAPTTPNIKIQANFAKVHVIDGDHGTANISPLANKNGSTVKLTASPASGYSFTGWVVDGSTKVVSTSSSWSFKASDEKVTYKPTFISSRVTLSTDGHGAVKSSNPNNKPGDAMTLSAEPVLLYKFKGWVKDGDTEICSTDNPMTVTAGNEVTNYKATFEASDYAYYRVQNTRKVKYTDTRDGASADRSQNYDYLKVVDNKSNGTNGSGLKIDFDLHALDFVSSNDGAITDEILCDPATVLLIKHVDDNYSDNYYDVYGQGVNTYDVAKNNHFEITYDVSGDKVVYTLHFYSGYLQEYYKTFDNSSSASSAMYWAHAINDKDNYLGFAPNEQMTDGKHYYQTLMTSFPYSYPENVDAFYVSKVKDNKATLTDMRSVTNNERYVPANTPVILRSTSTNVADNKLLPLMPDAVSVTSVSDNLLHGTLLSNNGHYYYNGDGTRGGFDWDNRVKWDANTMRVLSVNSQGKLGFYKLADGSYMKPNRAWLSGDFATAGSKISLVFDDATGIEEIKAPLPLEGQGEAAWYNLQGQKVEHPQHGVFIHNGKKVILK